MWSMEEARELYSALVEPDSVQSYAVRADKMFDEEVGYLSYTGILMFAWAPVELFVVNSILKLLFSL